MHQYLLAVAVSLVTVSAVTADDPKPAQTAAELKKQIAELEASLVKRKAEVAKLEMEIAAVNGEIKKINAAGDEQLKEIKTTYTNVIRLYVEAAEELHRVYQDADKAVSAAVEAFRLAVVELKAATDPKKIEELEKQLAAKKESVTEKEAAAAAAGRARNKASDQARDVASEASARMQKARYEVDKSKVPHIEKAQGLRRSLAELQDGIDRDDLAIKKLQFRLEELGK